MIRGGSDPGRPAFFKMPKFFKHLILVWTVVCVSGLSIFLFQVFGPGIETQTAYEGSSLVTSVVFFIFLWIVPVGVLVAAGRRQKDSN